VYFAFGSIIGNTFVSDAAAKTVGRPLDPLAELAGCDDEWVVVLELPLPQPVTSAKAATTEAARAASRARGALRNLDFLSAVLVVVRQYLSRLLVSWR
jgi:hypothetical protein